MNHNTRVLILSYDLGEAPVSDVNRAAGRFLCQIRTDQVHDSSHVVHDDVGVSQVRMVADPSEDPDGEAQLGPLPHDGVGRGVADHDGLGRLHPQLITDKESVVRVGLRDGVLVVTTENQVYKGVQGQSIQELLSPFSGVGGADGNLNSWI